MSEREREKIEPNFLFFGGFQGSYGDVDAAE